MNIFAKLKPTYISNEIDEYEEDEQTPSAEGRLYNLRQESVNEQTERLRKLLGYSDENSDENKK